MAIPVSNPPPPYEPLAPASPDPRGTFDPLDPPSPRDPRTARARGCFLLVGVAGAIGCVASIGLAVSCHSIVQIGEAEASARIAMGYRAAAVRENEASADDPDLRALDRLGQAGEISLVAFAVLNNRFNDAFVNDGVIEADELHRGMELVHEIVIGHGNIDINRYPSGR